MKPRGTQRRQWRVTKLLPLLPPLPSLLLLLLLLVTGCAGLPQAIGDDGDLAAANAALSARLLQTAGGGGSHKRHVTRPHPRSASQPPPSGDPAAALKVIRRRKVLSPRASRRSDVIGDDVTERTFRESLRPPFLALLNETHFSLQPEFVLAQASEHKMEPFRGFGEKLEVIGVAGRPRDFRAVPRSDGGAAGRLNATAGEGPANESGERLGKLVVRRKKVRVISGSDDDAPDKVSENVTENSEKVTNSSETLSTSKVSPNRDISAQTSEEKPGEPVSSTEKSAIATPSAPEEEPSVVGIIPRRIASKRRPGRLLVPLSKTTQPPTTEKPKPTRKSEPRNNSSTSSPGRASNATSAAVSRRPGVRGASLKPRRRPPGLDRSTPKSTVSPRTTTTTKSPARRRLSAAAQRRRERFRNRASRLRPNATTAAVSTTEAAPVNREKKEVEKVLGLLGRIRNRSRSRPSFLPKRVGDRDEGSPVTATTATPSTSPATTAKSSTAATTTTTTTEATTTTPKSTTSKTTTSTTTTASTTTARPTTTARRKTTLKPSTTTTTKSTTEKSETSSPVNFQPSTPASTTREATSQSSSEHKTSLSSSEVGAASHLSTTAPPPSTTSHTITSSSVATTTSSVPTKRRQRPDTLRRTPLKSTADRPNPLARRLEERGHTFSLRRGPKAGRKPVLPPTIAPFPLLLSTIKSAQQRGLLGRNVTISVTFPRGTAGFPRRPALPAPLPSRPPERQIPATANSTEDYDSPKLEQSEIKDKKLQDQESTTVLQKSDISDELGANDSIGESKAQEVSESDVPRTVLGTSMETSVSIAVSPLEFRLRKRVKLPTEATVRPAVAEDRPFGELESSHRNSDALPPGEQDGADVASSEDIEQTVGEQEIAFDHSNDSSRVESAKYASVVPVGERNQRPPTLESSAIETTELPLRIAQETSSSPSEDEFADREKIPSLSVKGEEEGEETDDVSTTSLDISESTFAATVGVRSGFARNTENKPGQVFPSTNNPDATVKFTSTSERNHYSNKEHSYTQDFASFGDDRSPESLPNGGATSNTDNRKPFFRRPSEEGFAYLSDSDFGEETYSDYDTDDLTAEASTTMATFARPTESEMERIRSAQDSARSPTAPSALPPIVHYSDHHERHPSAASISSEGSSPASPSPPSVSFTATSSPSPTSQTSFTTPREARVLEVVGDAQPASPEPEEPAAAGGPLYLVSLLFVVPVVAVLVWYLKKNHPDVQQMLPERLKSMLAQETPDHAQENFYPVEVDESAGKASTSNQSHDTLARRRRWEHPRDTLRLQSVLGEGHFGQVWRAEVDNIGGHQGTLLVAVKNTKESATAKEHQDLLRELRIMQDLGGHPNVVTLLGCCTTEEPVLVIMEYMVFGKLLTYLRENRGRHNYYNFSHDSAVLTSPDLTLFACQVAAGMEYIAEKGIIHRDLAARNILVDHTKVCKVSDFGMSRTVKEISTEVFEQKHRGALPIRWMSPESLYHNTFNQQTDCWSFGILLWEIITLGSTPYPGLSAREVMRSVREGYRLERPDHCHPQLYQLASSCWAAEPAWRPTFAELRNELETLLEDQNQGYVDLDRFQEEIYSTLHKSSDEKV